MTELRAHSLGIALGLVASACSDDGAAGEPDNPEEQITRVALAFSPEGGGASVDAAFRDPDGEGGMSGTTDPLTLAAGTTYALTITFANELALPLEDITAEVEEESEEHQLFVYGDAVSGPATMNASALLTHAYADAESDYGGNATGDDLPVGLANTVTTTDPGMGALRVMLRHLPELNGQPVKVAGLAERRRRRPVQRHGAVRGGRQLRESRAVTAIAHPLQFDCNSGRLQLPSRCIHARAQPRGRPSHHP
jgi:hypothetical protein